MLTELQRAVSLGEYLKCLNTNAHDARINRMNWKHFSAPKAMISLGIVRLCRISPMTGALACRTIGCSGVIGKAGKAKESH